MTKKKWLALGIVMAVAIAIGAIQEMPAKAGGIGAADYVLETVDNSLYLITVTTSAAVKITLTDADYTLVHLNIQNDGSTASVSTDYAVVQVVTDNAGAAVSSAANYTDGAKLIVGAGAAATFQTHTIATGTDGQHEIQIKAVGHGAKMQLIRGLSR